MRTLKRILWLALGVGVMVLGWRFAAENPAPVTIVFPFLTQVEGVALWLVLLVAFGCGAALVALLALLRIAQLRLLVRRYRKAASSLESEVHQLRNLPLAGDAARPPRGSAGSAPELIGPARTAGRGV